MKVILPKIELFNLIGKIQSVVPLKPSIPVLANILIEAIDDQLIISATDLTVSMRVYCEAKVEEEGAITLPAKRFFQLVRELTAPQVELHSTSPEVAYLNAGTSHFKLNGMHKSEFPQFPDLAEGAHISVSNATLKEMLSRTSFAAARDDSRQELNGVSLQQFDNRITFIGTDGKRLAQLQAAVESLHNGSYILPIKAVEEMTKVLENSDEPARITMMADKCAVEVGAVTLITKFLSGKYPDVSRVIPEKSPRPIVLHREELMSLLRQVSLFISDGSSAVRFTFTPGVLHLTANSGDIGEGNVSMPVNYTGEKLEAAFNPHYFLDILRHCKDETVNFDIADSYNPGLITDSSSALFMIMPMRLDA